MTVLPCRRRLSNEKLYTTLSGVHGALPFKLSFDHQSDN